MKGQRGVAGVMSPETAARLRMSAPTAQTGSSGKQAARKPPTTTAEDTTEHAVGGDDRTDDGLPADRSGHHAEGTQAEEALRLRH